MEQRQGPVYWDVVDQTALAQSIIEDKEVAGAEHYLIWDIFDTEDSEKPTEQAVIMTTRPELLPACVAVFYNPEDSRFTHLKGKFMQFSNITSKVPCLPDEAVRIDKGTGLVMCCTYGDWQDVEWVRKCRKIYEEKLKTVPYDPFGFNPFEFKSTMLIDKEGRFSGKRELTFSDLCDNCESFEYKRDERGQYPKAIEARKQIIDFIQKTTPDKIKEIKPIKHIVKVGERSKEPVEIIESTQLYVKTLDFKEDLLVLAKYVNFHPAHLKNRLIQWIEGLNQDWCISRDRFFGIEIPDNYDRQYYTLIEEIEGRFIYICNCFESSFVAKDEIEKWFITEIKEGEPEIDHEGPDYFCSGYCKYIPNDIDENIINYIEDCIYKSIDIEHSINDVDYIDISLLRNCIEKSFYVVENIVKEYLKLNQVFDTWFTSSSSPYVCRESERLERSKGEYDDRLKNTTALRPQAHEIIRTWTFSTMLKTYLMALIDNNLLEERAKNRDRIADWLEKDLGEKFIIEKLIPWKDVMLSGWCLAKDGAKMSKSAGNVITPTSLIQEKGSDIVRYWAGSCSLGVDTAFNETKFLDGKKLVNKLLNATKFATMHFERQNLQEKSLAECVKLIDKTADKWIVSRLVEVIKQYQKAFNEFEYSVAKNAVERLFWDEYCDNYLEIVKGRAYADDLSALATLRVMTEAFLLLFAPYVSHLTSAVYREIFNKEVHKCGSFAELFAIDFADKQAVEDMKIGLEIINFVRQKKADLKVSIKAPIKKLAVKEMPSSIEDDIKAMLSVENVEEGSDFEVEL